MKISRESVSRVARVVVLSAAISVVVGYLAFQMTMPSVSVPTTKNPSLFLAAAILFTVGLLAGFVSKDLESILVEVILGCSGGGLLGYLLFISPTFSPQVEVPFASQYLFAVLHSALPLLIIAAIVLFIGGLLGNAISETLETKTIPPAFGEEKGLSAADESGQHKS